MTHDEAKEFFDFATARWPEGSVFRYFARRPTDGTIYAEVLDNAESLTRVTDWADRNSYNSYWMPNPTRERGRIKARTSDITHWQWLLVDIDPITPNANPKACAIRVDGLLDDHFCGDLPAPLRVDSGRGYQSLYPIYPWPLDGVYDADAGIIERRTLAPQIASWWLHNLRKSLGPDQSYEGCTIDTSCSDLPRLMRMPYTVNAKTRKRTILRGWPSTRAFDALDLVAPVPVVKPENFHPKIVAARWTDFVPHMTVAGRRFLLEGQDEPGRHRQAAAAMLSMIDLGATKHQVLAALLYGAKRCTPPLEDKEVFDMVERRFR